MRLRFYLLRKETPQAQTSNIEEYAHTHVLDSI